MCRRATKNDAGIALLMCAIFTALSLVVLTVLALRLQGRARQSDAFLRGEQAFYAAEAAVAACRIALEAQGFGAPPLSETQSVCEGDASSTFRCISWAADGKDNNGDGTVDDPGEAGWFAAYGIGESRGIRRIVEVVGREGAGGHFNRVSWRELSPSAVLQEDP